MPKLSLNKFDCYEYWYCGDAVTKCDPFCDDVKSNGHTATF